MSGAVTTQEEMQYRTRAHYAGYTWPGTSIWHTRYIGRSLTDAQHARAATWEDRDALGKCNYDHVIIEEKRGHGLAPWVEMDEEENEQ